MLTRERERKDHKQAWGRSISLIFWANMVKRGCLKKIEVKKKITKVWGLVLLRNGVNLSKMAESAAFNGINIV
jgi:hypothetical protein